MVISVIEMNKVFWKTITIDEYFEVLNLTPLHKVNLISDPINGVPYITRTEKNNGVEGFVKADGFQLHSGKCITFGAETVKFFYQPFDFLCGNKMYGIYRKDGEEITYNQGGFLREIFKNSLNNTGYGYGLGLTGTRFKRRNIKLPFEGGYIAWDFIESFISEISKGVEERLPQLEINEITDFRELDEIEWADFSISDIFNIESGVRLTNKNMIPGETPFIGASVEGNGITNYISNKNASLDKDVLGVIYNGNGMVVSFYHPYEALFSDDVKRWRFKDIKGNKYQYLFIKPLLLKQKAKYQYGYKFSGDRMLRQKILLPVLYDGTPDYEFMEQYMKRQENKVISRIKQEEAGR